MADGSGIHLIKMGTAGCAEMYKSILLKDVPREKLRRFEEYLDEYYKMRLWHETGIGSVPVGAGPDDESIQKADIKIAQIHD